MSGTARPPTSSGPAARRVIKPVPPQDPNPSASEIGDRARLAEEVRGSLERVRNTAENWRTGVAGLVTLVTATLLFKGQNMITAYEPWVRYVPQYADRYTLPEAAKCTLHHNRGIEKQELVAWP